MKLNVVALLNNKYLITLSDMIKNRYFMTSDKLAKHKLSRYLIYTKFYVAKIT